jgi:hypothetical protein
MIPKADLQALREHLEKYDLVTKVHKDDDLQKWLYVQLNLATCRWNKGLVVVCPQQIARALKPLAPTTERVPLKTWRYNISQVLQYLYWNKQTLTVHNAQKKSSQPDYTGCYRNTYTYKRLYV